MKLPNWNWTLIAVAVIFHSIAILSTVFRLWYRWYTALMWWDDAWAFLAFLAGITFLVVALVEKPIPHDVLPHFFVLGNWIVSFAYPIVTWAARISILISMLRVSHPEGMLRRVTIGIGLFLGIIGVVMTALRILLCITRACLMTDAIFISQITTESVGDVLLSALPIWSLRYLKLGRKQKALIRSVFSASIVIHIVTIVEAVAVLRSMTSGSIIFEHVKVACSIIVCNLLVIVTFVYRIWHKDKDDVGDATKLEFTTIDLGALSQDMSEHGAYISQANFREDKVIYSAVSW